MTHPTVKRAKVTVHSTDLCCQVRRAVGWTNVCACGARFPIRRDEAVAREDGRSHTATCRDVGTGSGNRRDLLGMGDEV